MAGVDKNGDRWDWDSSPERIEPDEVVRRLEDRRDRVAWSFVIVVPFIAVGQMLLAALAGLGLMEFSDGVLMILTGSVPIELLITLRMVVRKVL